MFENLLSKEENDSMKKILDCKSLDDSESLKKQNIEILKLLYTYKGYFVPNVFTYCIYKTLFGCENVKRENLNNSGKKKVEDLECFSLCLISIGKNMLEVIDLIRKTGNTFTADSKIYKKIKD